MSPPFENPIPSDSKIPRILLTNELVTGPPAQEMLRRAGTLFSSPAPVILDNACGAGIITALLQQQAGTQGASDRLKVIAADKAPSMVAVMELRARESGWTNVTAQQFDQSDMPLADESVDHAFTNFGIFFSPNDGEVLQQVRRVLKPGGVAGFTSWKTIAWWPMAEAALKTKLPGSPPLPDVSKMFTAGWNDAENVSKKMEGAGFNDLQVQEFKFAPLVGPDRFGEATGELVKGVAMRTWEENARKEFADRITNAITEYLKETYADGAWDGEMTAIISLGKK